MWTVFFVSKDDGVHETVEAQVLVSDASGEITEVRTGPQVAWSMARGYDGAFGRAVSRPAIWIPLSLLFLFALLPFMRPRRLLSMRTLDLLVLLSFGFSLIWFNRGEIFTSVPLQYPPMVYLCLRLAWIAAARARAARRRGVPEQEPGPPARRRPVFGGSAPTWLLVTLLAVALALRFGLNAFDSNVIDVGYAGVIGADRITHGETPYGTFPADCSTCDTYGPLNYIAYVPFELTQPWHGTWDSLPAAHGAATLFDLLCIGGLLMLGWQLSGLRLGIGSGAGVVGLPLHRVRAGEQLQRLPRRGHADLGAGGGATSTRPRPAAGARAGHQVRSGGAGAAVEPLAVPAGGILAAAHPLRGGARPGRGADGLGAAAGRPRRRAGLLVAHGRATSRTELAVLPVGPVPGPAAGPDRPDGGRGPGRRRGAPLAAAARPLTMSALSGALLIGLELTVTHWFYLYIPWFLPFALVAMVPDWPPPARDAGTAPGPAREPRREPLPVGA